ncbi:MAG: 30S ribosomal protein S3 [Candidatus Woesearchaeota archaeon]
MIERKFVAENLKEYQIEEYMRSILGKAGIAYIKLQRTPLGEKILVCASRPGIIVGKSGSNITKLTRDLKNRFQLDNPQIELVEAENPLLDANIMAESIANSLERFGTSKFKGIGHKAMSDIMNAGARGVEILISGKVPSSRAKTWRFYMGYLKKSGDVAVSGVKVAYAQAKLKTGIIGVQVRIMPSTTILPDDIKYSEATVQDTTTNKTEILTEKTLEEEKEEKKESSDKNVHKDKKPVKKRVVKKKTSRKSKSEK